MKQLNKFWNDRIYLTDGGLETTLIFHQGFELRYFASFELLKTAAGKAALADYFQPYLAIAASYQTGFIFETPTWRANPDWGYRMGYTHQELMAINKLSIPFIRGLAEESNIDHAIISGNIGPRGDGYKVETLMSIDEARAYHFSQVQAFVNADADIVTALTINYMEEAIGISHAAKDFQIPCVISFTVETDGRLPNGQHLQDAIEGTDAATNGYPLYYMINCAHPQHFKNVLEKGSDWVQRIIGLRANASTKSHAELDEAETLDTGDACLLANDYAALKNALPNLRVFGGCCGTDASHLAEIGRHIMEKEEIA